jgi:FixJ family two-component response regulator
MISFRGRCATLARRDGSASIKASSSRARTGCLPKVPVVSVIDDDESVRIATASLVRSLRWRVRTFASAEDFLASLQAADTSCIIADVQMPGMSGLELQRLLQAQGHRTPIIFITAFPDERTERRALAAGAAGFLVKPFDGQALVQCLRTALQRNGNGEAT